MIYERGYGRIKENAAFILAGSELCLYANDAKLNGASSFDFEEAKGYKPRLMTDVGWRFNDPEDGEMSGFYEPIEFKIGENQTIYGYFFRGADGSVIVAESLDEPFEANAGDWLTVFPQIVIQVRS